MSEEYTVSAQVLTDITLEIFRLGGTLVAEGDRLTRDLGLTSARWKVLGAIDMEARPLTVPQIARRMGLTRQAVQRIVDEMRGMGLVEISPNPDHLRSPIVSCTPNGKATYEKIMRRYTAWANRLAETMESSELKKALKVLQNLALRLNEVPYTTVRAKRARSKS